MDTNSRQPIRIAVIGAGAIGPRHASAVKQNPDAALACIVDPSPTAIQIAIRLGTRYYPSVQSMVQSAMSKPDIAIVCSPNDTHADLSTELLSAGIHVLCEKPLSTDSASGQTLIAHAAAKELHLLTGHHRRFNPYVVAAKRILASEERSLGLITAVSGLWALYKPQVYFDEPTEWHRTREAGGPVMINLIHDIDVLHYLLDSKVKRVAAFEAPKRRGYDAEEGGAILLHFDNGVVGTFVLSDAVVSQHSFEMGTGENPLIAKTGRDVYRIFGTAGTLSIPDLKRSFYSDSQEKSWHSQVTEVTEILEDLLSDDERAKVPFELQVANVVGVLRGEQQPACTGEDGLAAVKVAEAVKRALSTGGVVDV
ncbi:hypothetical protein M406DRAFT_40927 [Cryphonectria parasitica EP155]|uniref:Oxidoreductase n=1 Tax=Cryphonectria parasitica (strain ATCC 38755 / EP155) TaxID=660469 RepID=A0A9P5CR34_CRYP1|nr:uncharacterized protein M406DRAFT_40927 [Cryphonectria parasitica EP155]KAF3768139.1 hypothetical protein M406DRAFT_40927 [Cryphonectria parasitica EP155]